MTSKKISIAFTLNGKKVKTEAYPMSRLLDVLREDLKFCGTKEGCGEGECGACSVMLNGELVNSCLVPALQVEGADILSIEGLATGEELTQLQQSFVDCGGSQCGICTPGMIMASYALLKKDSKPNDAAVAEALAGNLCRCTGYMRIFEAVKDAAKKAVLP